MSSGKARNPGIFVVTGAMMPIQIIKSKVFTVDENLLIRNLTRELSEPEQDLKWLKRLKQEYRSKLDIGSFMAYIGTAGFYKSLLSERHDP